MIEALLPLVAYLAGSVSSAILVSRLLGLPDPRAQGSKNPGATNVLRLGGKKAAALTLAGDMLKGLLPVLAAHALQAPGWSNWIVPACALGAFLGHLYPVFFGFKGGKGVATLLGALLGLSWLVGLAVIATWLVVAFLFRYSSLAALSAALAAPFYCLWLLPTPLYAATVAVMSTLLWWRHRSNIRNLLAGTEGRLGAG
jgi:glycerol-3-phosphate acyltransferase PlsY